MYLIMHVYTHRCTWNCPHGVASPVFFSSSVTQFFHGIGWEGTPQGWSMLCVWLLVALFQHPWVSNYAVIRQHQIQWHQHAHPGKSSSKDFLDIWYICINLPTFSNIFFNWVSRHDTFDHCDFRTILPSKIIPTIPHAESHRHSSKRRWTVHGSIGTVGPMVFLTHKTPGRLSASGQYLPKSGGCIATSRTGRPCQIPRATKLMPYCKPCDLAHLMVLVVIFSPIFCCSKKKTKKYIKLYWLQPWACQTIFYVQVCIQNQGMMKGDPSLKAVKHPKFGKILVATRNLPKGYYAAWWGKLCPKKQVPFKRMEWALETSKGMVDAIPYKGSQLKYCACPGGIRITTHRLAASTSHLENWKIGWQVPASCLPLILHPIVLLPQTTF